MYAAGVQDLLLTVECAVFLGSTFVRGILAVTYFMITNRCIVS